MVRCAPRSNPQAHPTSKRAWRAATISSETSAAWAQILPTTKTHSVAGTAYLPPRRLDTDQRKYKEDWLPHKSLYAVDQMSHVEVEQQSDMKAAQLQVRQDSGV